MPPSVTQKHAKDSTRRQPTPLVSSGFVRVSKKRPCRICKQSTWCGFSRDQRTSICMRVSEGRRGISQNGGNIHVHTEIPNTIPILTATHSPPPTIPLAPIEVRHAVFTEMIRLSPAAKYRTELVTGPSGLYARGLVHQHALSLGALPPTQDGRTALAEALSKFVSGIFPAYTKLYGAGVIGIPGFWQDISGKVHVWKLHNYRMPALVIPYKDAHGLIQACQIRLHQDDIRYGEKKYRWLASPSERRGTSSGTPIHFTFSPTTLSPGETVVITEGALKAETFVHHRPKARVIATSGVSCSHDQLVEAARPYNALIAFDADHRINPSVCRQLARLIARRFEDSTQHELTNTTRILFWEGPKGIDEAAQQNVRLQTKTVCEWYETLTNGPREEVGRFWSEISFHP